MNNIIETIHKRENRNNIIHTHNITNFERRDLKKLEKLEKTDLDLEIEEMKG
jgi:hypothetical protein